MAELLFVLLTIYVVYIIHGVIYKKNVDKEVSTHSKPSVVAESVKSPVKKVAVKQEKPAVKKPVAKKTSPAKPKPKAPAKTATKAKKPAASKGSSTSGSLRNPQTGEVTKMAGSYRMSKRWIKDALVTEGLLPKVYKTTEMTDTEKTKSMTALAKLAKMDKYTQDL